jgi:hypothetical protein
MAIFATFGNLILCCCLDKRNSNTLDQRAEVYNQKGNYNWTYKKPCKGTASVPYIDMISPCLLTYAQKGGILARVSSKSRLSTCSMFPEEMKHGSVNNGTMRLDGR